MDTLFAQETSVAVRIAIFVLAGALCLLPWATPPLALALGAALALTLNNPFRDAGHRASKWLLQGCVVALGFGMDLRSVLRAGAEGASMAGFTIATALALGYVVGRLLGIRTVTSVLISAGTAICGGSAIAAVGSAVGAEQGDMTVAMGVVFLLNGAALYLFPVVGHALHLTGSQFGLWAGVAIHDISSVVGAASQYGPDALRIATAVKLSRALWIVPLTLCVAFVTSRGERPALTNAAFGFDAPERSTLRKIQIPWFILLFVLASMCRSLLPGVAAAEPVLSRMAKTGLTFTLFLIGAGLSAETLHRVGWKALAQGIVLWLAISAGSLWAIF